MAKCFEPARHSRHNFTQRPTWAQKNPNPSAKNLRTSLPHHQTPMRKVTGNKGDPTEAQNLHSFVCAGPDWASAKLSWKPQEKNKSYGQLYYV